MKAERRHDIDALRVIAFSLLILYHVGMFYVADWGWHVKSAYQADWLQLPMTLLNQWRMPLLFIISGLAMSFVIERYSPGRLAGRRVLRLLLPLLFGMAVIVAPQCYYEALEKGLIEPGFARFMVQYLTFQDFPGEAWGGENMIVWTWNHLWYLAYIQVYTLLLILFTAAFPRATAALQRAVQRLRGGVARRHPGCDAARIRQVYLSSRAIYQPCADRRLVRTCDVRQLLPDRLSCWSQ